MTDVASSSRSGHDEARGFRRRDIRAQHPFQLREASRSSTFRITIDWVSEAPSRCVARHRPTVGPPCGVSTGSCGAALPPAPFPSQTCKQPEISTFLGFTVFGAG